MVKTLDRELRSGTLEMILLQLLAGRTMYGYELIATLERVGGAAFLLKEGTLYPVLYRLEDAGLITARWETADRGVPRKYYRVTAAGSVELARLREEWQGFAASVDRLMEFKEGALS